MSTATSTPYQQLATAELERHGADTIGDLCVNDGAEAEFCPLCWIIRHPFLFGLWK